MADFLVIYPSTFVIYSIYNTYHLGKEEKIFLLFHGGEFSCLLLQFFVWVFFFFVILLSKKGKFCGTLQPEPSPPRSQSLPPLSRFLQA